MREYNKNTHKFFGESAIYEPGEEEKAKTYLESWKTFLLRRLDGDSFSVKVIDEQWGDRPFGFLAQRNCMYLKIVLEAEWKYELK